MNYKNLQFDLGKRRLVNQQKARKYITRILKSGRISHAYLFTGPSGSGKTALALAFAEIINGVDNITALNEQNFSKKSSWFTHPDIHLFLPMPASYKMDDLKDRLMLLSEDPYEIVDFNRRPSLSDIESSKNKQSFYPIDYFSEEIRPKAYLKPNEGEKTVVIITDIELMRKEAANAFLKLLEEPAENLAFILTTSQYETLLPTIKSRCQQIKLNVLTAEDIEEALVEYENMPPDDAQYLARISGGNYALARFYDIDRVKKDRKEVVDYLRNAYSKNAVELVQTANDWNKRTNIQGQIMLLNILEMFLRDLLVFRDSNGKQFITNIDQLETIKKFCKNLEDAAIDGMINEVNRSRPLLYQNVQAKLIFTTLALRLSNLMKNRETPIPENEIWQHLPAFVE